MKRSRWASLILVACVGLSGQRADAMRTSLTDVRAAITQPHQLPAETASTDLPADAWIVESIIPLGTTTDGQPLALISLLVPNTSLDELTPASTRAGPYAAPETHTRVFCIVQPPLGLEVWVDAEWLRDSKGMLHTSKQAHYDAKHKKWEFRNVNTEVDAVDKVTWAFEEYRSEFAKLIDTDEGLALYAYLDKWSEDLYIKFRDIKDTKGQEYAQGIYINPFLYRDEAVVPGYGIIAHEFQHKTETLAFTSFRNQNGDRRPSPDEYRELYDTVLNVSNEYQFKNERRFVWFEKWAGERSKGVLSTSKEARAIRAQNIVVMKYRSKHHERILFPQGYYPKEGYVHQPVPREYWTEDYRRKQDQYRDNQMMLKALERR